MFEIGQLVTCKEFGRYNITDKGKPLRVISIGGTQIRVEATWDCDNYWVNKDLMRPMDEKEVLKEGQLLKIIADDEVVSATFSNYCDYGIKVILENGLPYTLEMKYIVHSNIKGGLYV
jgi:hypothetical protein|nr:MAG TPA: ProQ C-terminal domain [Caudoviricetes sp.]